MDMPFVKDFSETVTGLAATGVHAGLSNPGATCYLNSLLQALYACEEFRCQVFAARGCGPVTAALQKIPALTDVEAAEVAALARATVRSRRGSRPFSPPWRARR